MTAAAAFGAALGGAFGAGELAVERRPEVVPGSVELERAVAAFAALQQDDGPVAVFSRCGPTAAFGRLDTLRPGYDRAAGIARRHGFEPVVRPVGGRLAAYDESSLVVHVRAGHPDPRWDIQRRFEAFAAILRDALTDLGISDVQVGPVPGEYCAGAWSVNVGGRHKVVGTGQRLSRRGFLFSAVVSVAGAEPLRELLAETYAALELEFAPDSVGTLDRWVPGVGVDDVQLAVERAMLARHGLLARR